MRIATMATLRSGLAGVFLTCFACGTAGSCSSASNNQTGKPQQTTASADGTTSPAPAKAEFDVFVFGRTLGTIAPCGCTTEPLGGLQYAFGFLDQQSKPGARLVVEPGSFLFPDPDGPDWPGSEEAEWGQAKKRATALHGSFSALGDALVSGLGPTDGVSPEGLAPLKEFPLPRVVANVTGEGLADVPKYRIVALEDHGLTLKVGVTAVVDPKAPGADKLGTVSDPVAAASETIKAMRDEGATATIVLAQGVRSFAERIAHDATGADLVVVGLARGLERQRLGKAMTRSGNAYVLEPGEQLQTLTHLTLTVDASQSAVPMPNAWTVAPSAAQRRDELARIEEQIAELKANKDAEASFIKRLEAERDRVAKELERGPEGAVVATFEQAKITCKLPVDATAKTELTEYNAWVAEGNKKRFAGVKAPPAPAGTAGYVGIEECETCHEEAVEFWKKTPHGSAYQTLVDTNQQFDLSCVSCHVTGFREPGGSEVVENAGLIDVQCEVCHGPGSLHVDEPDRDGKALNIRLDSPEDVVCAGCHTAEHSDTFDYDAYLRDIVGEGHGKERRAKLGEGPTGSELRAAGLAKAGGSCKKM
ncbi:MAG: multiheme c-type cytochrome [Myxococcota bacterium]